MKGKGVHLGPYKLHVIGNNCIGEFEGKMRNQDDINNQCVVFIFYKALW